ncbi:MAG: hypothetical protein U5K55_14870 [Aliarcobacter sp.]|nr:hypothetical protein [Aliarcobacter sp.]
MLKWFKIGKYRFNNIEELKAVQNLAIANGLNSMEDFTNFLDGYYNK